MNRFTSNRLYNINKNNPNQKLSGSVSEINICSKSKTLMEKNPPMKNYYTSVNAEESDSIQNQVLPPSWNPAVKAVASAAKVHMSNPNAALEISMGVGQRFLAKGTSCMVPGFERVMINLRIYFAVNNQYVKRKIYRVLFSFFYTHWKRMELDPTERGISLHKYALPLYDDNSFDLYIPTMSLVTYVLLCAICYGSSGNFDPDFLSFTAKSCFVSQVIEVLFDRLGFYVMQAPCEFLDLFAVTGYKYLGLCVNILLGLLLVRLGYGHRAYYVIFVWTACATSYFMLKTMTNIIPKETAPTGPKRHFMVWLFAVCHFVTMWYLCETKILT